MPYKFTVQYQSGRQETLHFKTITDAKTARLDLQHMKKLGKVVDWQETQYANKKN